MCGKSGAIIARVIIEVGKMKKKLFRDIKLKTGFTLQKGLVVTVQPLNNELCEVFVGDQVYKLRYQSVFKAPSIKTLMKQEFDGVCKTPAGKRVEPDGHDSEGYPSWLLIAGVI